MTKFINPLDIPQLNILVSQKSGLTINEKGVDSMSYIIREEASLKWLKSLGYEALEDYQNTAVSRYIDKRLAYEKRTQKGNKQTEYEPTAIVLKLIGEKGLSSYIILYKNVSESIKEAIKQKKSKDTFVFLEIHGLDQPSKNITVNTMKMLSKIIKRKAFKLHSYDLAQDVLKHVPKVELPKENFFDEPKKEVSETLEALSDRIIAIAEKMEDNTINIDGVIKLKLPTKHWLKS
ncbi:MAG: hypothetical protein IE881_03205 [Epsilonproteobacteria bacterium]|nr:hypothetical protein [Campylobacterota bacterium]